MSTRLKSISDSPTVSLSNKNITRIAILVSEWHPEVTEKLYDGALRTLLSNGIKHTNIIRENVPGSYELPLGAQLLLKKRFNATICLGCVIKGETDHYHYICEAISNGILQVSLKENKPIAFGVLTTDTLSQALDRSGGKYGNKGEEAATAVLRMLQLKGKYFF